MIERPEERPHYRVQRSRPGVVIGKKGEDIEALKVELQKMLGVPVHEHRGGAQARDSMRNSLRTRSRSSCRKRIMFRRAMKRAITNAMRLGAQGIKIMSAGRLNGIEIARTEWYREGRVPLHLMRAEIDYGVSEAKTSYGVIGIKVWVFKGEVMQKNEQPVIAPAVSAIAPTAPVPAPTPAAPAPTAPAAATDKPKKPRRAPAQAQSRSKKCATRKT